MSLNLIKYSSHLEENTGSPNKMRIESQTNINQSPIMVTNTQLPAVAVKLVLFFFELPIILYTLSFEFLSLS